MDFEFIESSSSTSGLLLPECPCVDSKPILKIEEPNPLTIEVDAAYFGELLAVKKYHEQIIKNVQCETKATESAFIKGERSLSHQHGPYEENDIKTEEQIAYANDYDNNEIIAEDFVKTELLDSSIDGVENQTRRKTVSKTRSKKYSNTKTRNSMIMNPKADVRVPKTPKKPKKPKKRRPSKPHTDSEQSKTFKCPICELTIKNRIYNLKRHMKNMHSEGSKVYSCSFCYFQCCNKSEMRKHMAEHREKAIFECFLCKKRFDSRKGIKQHMMCHIGKDDPNRPDPRPFICSFCGQAFKKSADVKRHEENHSGARPYICEQLNCGKQFRNKFDLRAHYRRVHSDQVPKKNEAVPCNVCGKVLSTPSNLKEHMRVHSDSRPFVCETCGDTFRYVYSFRIHKRIHTGEKPYPCRFCEMCFAHESTRRIHELKHKSECPKACEFCDRKFRSSSTLKAHIQIHTKEWRFRCSLCSQGFARSGDFKRHLERHKNADRQQRQE